MSFIVLHADRAATLVADDPVVPATELRLVQSAIGLFGEAGALRSDIAGQVEAARSAAHDEGFAAGMAAGRAAAEAELRAELFRLAIRDGEERRRHQSEIGALAIEVVRRVAGEIGEPAFVAGLADRAAALVAPDAAATVRVPPAAVEAVQARLVDRPTFKVEADPALDGTDCVVETALGHTHAGLETQLGQIDVAWREAGRGE